MFGGENFQWGKTVISWPLVFVSKSLEHWNLWVFERKKTQTRLPDVCVMVKVVVVMTVVDVVVAPSTSVRLASGWPGSFLYFTGVSLVSPFSILTEMGAKVAPAGKALWLWDWLLREDKGAAGLFSLPEPPLFGVTCVVRESVVGSSLSAPPVFSLEDFFWERYKGGLGVVGENVVSGEVAARVAVVAMSENAGASSWGTSWVEGSPTSEADTEPGMVGYAATEPSLLKKCWSPWKSLVSRCSWSSRPLRTGRWLGTFTGETVVTKWTSLSVSCVGECVKRSLSGSSVLLLMPLISFTPEEKGIQIMAVLSNRFKFQWPTVQAHNSVKSSQRN